MFVNYFLCVRAQKRRGATTPTGDDIPPYKEHEEVYLVGEGGPNFEFSILGTAKIGDPQVAHVHMHSTYTLQQA